LMIEGKAMLETLVESFVSCGHRVYYPTKTVYIKKGIPIISDDLKEALSSISSYCDAALIIAPDELLSEYIEIIEKNSVNLGSSPKAVKICSDKLKCSELLEKNNIPVPITIEKGDYKGDFVIKPRYGCDSEDVYKSSSGTLKKGFIATGFIKGEHISVSLISGKTILFLTINKQFIKIEKDDRFSYNGGIVSYECDRKKEVIDIAKKAAKLLGCKGYVGIDIILGDKPYIVDVNPRPTTSIIGISKILDIEIADLILKSKFGELPKKVSIDKSFTLLRSLL